MVLSICMFTSLVMEGSTCSSLPEDSDGLTEVQASQPQRTLERWEDKHVRLLIESYLQFKGLIGQANTKKSVFDKIAAEFNKHSDIKVSAEQCLRKWKKLESKQKEIDDNNKQTGRAHKTWKFQKEMEQCIGDKASVRPVFTFDSGSSTSSSTHSPSPRVICYWWLSPFVILETRLWQLSLYCAPVYLTIKTVCCIFVVFTIFT